jgi:hypothetical protein
MREVHDLTALSLVVCGEKKTRCQRKPSVVTLIKRAEEAGKTVARDRDAEPIGRDTPLRLGVAVGLAFPAGGMTEAGLRTEIRRGTLPVEIIARKQFVTLAGIDQMRETCRAPAKEPASTSKEQSGTRRAKSLDQRVTSSETESLSAARAALRQTLNGQTTCSPSTSVQSGKSAESATVVPLKS